MFLEIVLVSMVILFVASCYVIWNLNTKLEALEDWITNFMNIIDKVQIPVVAIGGLQLKNIPQLKEIGVSGFAIISAIFGEEDPQSSFKKFKKLAKF